MNNIVLFADTIPKKEINKMDLKDTICTCLGITNGMIKDAVDSGARTLEEVQEITEVGTICGACLDDVQQLIDELVKEK